jgi:chromosome segregation ATPase
MIDNVAKELEDTKATQYKETQKLFELRAKQASLIGEISSTLSASRNLTANINKLRVEEDRQQELLYNADYSIQQQNRKIARAEGERTQEEKTKLEKEKEKLNNVLKERQAELDQIVKQNKEILDEHRNIRRTIETEEKRQEQLVVTIQELEVENEMAKNDLNKVTLIKEKTLVQHDTMKLEILALRDAVNTAADIVYGQENKKYQLEMSMEEREKEIQVHKDILVTELKSAEEERHKVAVELQERQKMVKNLRIKYEGLV